jgi:hypothetical protein
VSTPLDKLKAEKRQKKYGICNFKG